jgi:hypothetical protein
MRCQTPATDFRSGRYHGHSRLRPSDSQADRSVHPADLLRPSPQSSADSVASQTHSTRCSQAAGLAPRAGGRRGRQYLRLQGGAGRGTSPMPMRAPPQTTTVLMNAAAGTLVIAGIVDPRCPCPTGVGRAQIVVTLLGTRRGRRDSSYGAGRCRPTIPRLAHPSRQGPTTPRDMPVVRRASTRTPSVARRRRMIPCLGLPAPLIPFGAALDSSVGLTSDTDQRSLVSCMCCPLQRSRGVGPYSPGVTSRPRSGQRAGACEIGRLRLDTTH